MRFSDQGLENPAGRWYRAQGQPAALVAAAARRCSRHRLSQVLWHFFPGKYHRGLEQEGDTLCATAAPSVQSKGLNLQMRSCQEEGAGTMGRQGEGQVSGAAPAHWNC